MTVSIYEVFRRERAGAAMQHAGSVAAPDERFAEIYAREQYGRRGESDALWLVRRDAVHEIAEFVDEFDLKYRRVDGYSIKERLSERRRCGSLTTTSRRRAALTRRFRRGVVLTAWISFSPSQTTS